MRFYQLFVTTALISGTCLSVSQAQESQQQGTASTPSSAASQSTLNSMVKGQEVSAPASPKPLIGDRTPGTITLKPLSVNFSNLTFGMRKKTMRINEIATDPYRTSFGYLSNQGDGATVAYDFELGIMATSNIEVFTIVGVSYEHPFSDVLLPLSDGSGRTLAFNFKPRWNSQVSLGGRYYWNTEKPWFPFVGLMGTVRFQGNVKSDVLNATTPTSRSFIGPLTLQGRKTLWGGTLQAGADYQFTKWLSLSLSLGLQYTSRSNVTVTSIDGREIRTRSNRNVVTVPVVASLKVTL